MALTIVHGILPDRIIANSLLRLTPGISGERQFKVHERKAMERVRSMPLLGCALRGKNVTYH